jgi:hypothetical protein
MERTTIIGNINPLPINEVKFLRIIKIMGPDYNPFVAYLPYTRTFSRDRFNSANGDIEADILDKELLSAIQQSYPRTEGYRYRLMVFEGQLEDELYRIRGGANKASTIRFSPQIDYDNIEELAGKSFPAREIELNLRVNLFDDDKKLKHIYTDFICDLPHERLIGLWETIQAV